MESFKKYKKIKIINGKLPKLYILDSEMDEQQKNDFIIDNLSKINKNLNQKHSNLTFQTIRAIVKDLDKNNVIAINQKRKKENTLGILPEVNTPEAILSLLLYDLSPGDVLIVNVEYLNLEYPNENYSVANDNLMLDLLTMISNNYNVVVIVAAGNGNYEMNNKYDNNIIIVGGLFYSNSNYTVASNYGNLLTCYAQVPISVARYGLFENSSAATAQITGLVLLMQKYANSKGRFLTPAEIKKTLNENGRIVNIVGKNNASIPCTIPEWNKIKIAIDNIFLPKSTI